MNHLVEAAGAAVVCLVFAGAVAWEWRQYVLAKKDAGQPCKHGHMRHHCRHCRRRRSLFSLFQPRIQDQDSGRLEDHDQQD